MIFNFLISMLVQTVDDAISAGIDGYDADMKAAVRNGVVGLRLSQEAAMEIAAKAVSNLPLIILLAFDMHWIDYLEGPAAVNDLSHFCY